MSLNSSVVALAVYAVLAVLLISGWVLNIVQILHMINLPVSALLVFKAVGVFVAPLGVILGWCGAL